MTDRALYVLALRLGYPPALPRARLRGISTVGSIPAVRMAAISSRSSILLPFVNWLRSLCRGHGPQANRRTGRGVGPRVEQHRAERSVSTGHARDLGAATAGACTCPSTTATGDLCPAEQRQVAPSPRVISAR